MKKEPGHRPLVRHLDVYGHLFTKAEDDIELFDKMEQDLMGA